MKGFGEKYTKRSDVIDYAKDKKIKCPVCGRLAATRYTDHDRGVIVYKHNKRMIFEDRGYRRCTIETTYHEAKC